jgi:hypothetical protein
MYKYRVITWNIGTVYTGNSKADAERSYAESVQLSQADYGRFAGENVVMFCDDDVVMEFVGSIEQNQLGE